VLLAFLPFVSSDRAGYADDEKEFVSRRSAADWEPLPCKTKRS